MSLNPMDTSLWPMGPILAWWDSTNPGPAPRWMPDPVTARKRLRSRLILTALGLTHSHRTITTGQLHRLDPKLPANPNSLLWRDMAALGLVDLGYPMHASGRWAATPTSATLMALRLPRLHDITDSLTNLGCTPPQIISLGPTPLRGVRQYDRHNLICSELSCRFRDLGWRTWGEAWCRFSLLYHDETAGRGGADLMLARRDGLLVAIEATASGTGINEKARRWIRLMDTHPDTPVIVVWLDCASDAMGASVASELRHIPGAAGRMRLASGRDWLTGQPGLLADGDTLDDLPGPGRPLLDPSDWMRTTMGDIAAGFGLDRDAAMDWPLPDRLHGFWAG